MAQARGPLPREVGEVGLQQALRDVGSDHLALLVASHPDDQYLQPAALLRFRYGWRVAVALMTRGEGGQNISGSETGDALAVRRSRETEHCAARLGIDVHFLDRPDGGFCRSAEEALDLWGRVATTNDLARLIRQLRPDVVWTTHHPGEDHGHDLALLRLLPDAVERAATALHRGDGLPPHRVRAAIRNCSPGEASAFEISGDGMDPVRGITYRQLAYRALSDHRSQAPFRPMDDVFPLVLRLRGLTADKVSPIDFAAPPGGLFATLDALGRRDVDVGALRRGLDLAAVVADRASLVRRGLEVRLPLAKLANDPEPQLAVRAERRLRALDALLVHALSVSASATVADGTVAVAGESLALQVTVDAGEVLPLADVRLRVPRQALLEETIAVGLGPVPVGGHLLREFVCRVAASESIPPSPFTPPSARVHFELDVAGQTLVWPVEVAVPLRPGIEASPTRPALLWSHDRRTALLAVRLQNHLAATAKGPLQARAPVGWRIEPASVAVELPAGATRVYTFEASAPEDVRPGVASLRFTFQDAIAEVAVHRVDVRVPRRLRVGLVPGVDDASRRVLEDFGVELHVLDGEDSATFALASLDTLLVDIRALRTQDTARAAFARFLEFADAGGRLVVLYHKDKEWDAPGFVGSPFPMRIGRGRVTQEDAPMRMLVEEHPLLRLPNRIAASDWDGWVQERGLYFAEDYDARYEEIVACADDGHDELRGGLLYARAGRGEYVYCALALFRQLKQLHPGACRLFANLITPAAGR